jgi:hypothetical protein
MEHMKQPFPWRKTKSAMTSAMTPATTSATTSAMTSMLQEAHMSHDDAHQSRKRRETTSSEMRDGRMAGR